MKTSIFIVLFFSNLVFAGVMNGGGGKGVVCLDTHHQIKSVELLDLWEARTIYGRTPIHPKLSVEKQVNFLLESLKTSIYNRTEFATIGGVDFVGAEAYKQIMKMNTDRFFYPDNHVHWLSGVKLDLTNDSFEIARPTNCEIRQLARYTDTTGWGDVLIDKDLFDKMDNTNKAALIIHEAYYANLRGFGEKSSIRIRRAIGLAINGYKFINPTDYMTNKKPEFACLSNGTLIYIFHPNNPNEFSIFPAIIAGRAFIGYTGPSSGSTTTNIDDLFTHVTQEFGALGPAGSDFNYSVTLRNDSAGNHVADFTFRSPDEPNGIKLSDLRCEVVGN